MKTMKPVVTIGQIFDAYNKLIQEIIAATGIKDGKKISEPRFLKFKLMDDMIAKLERAIMQVENNELDQALETIQEATLAFYWKQVAYVNNLMIYNFHKSVKELRENRMPEDLLDQVVKKMGELDSLLLNKHNVDLTKAGILHNEILATIDRVKNEYDRRVKNKNTPKVKAPSPIRGQKQAPNMSNEASQMKNAIAGLRIV